MSLIVTHITKGTDEGDWCQHSSVVCPLQTVCHPDKLKLLSSWSAKLEVWPAKEKIEKNPGLVWLL